MIQIKIDNLDEICQEYSIAVFNKFSLTNKAFITIIKRILENAESVKADFDGLHLKTLSAAIKILFPKSLISTNSTWDDFIELVNFYRIKTDRRSKCRKSKSYRELLKQLELLESNVRQKNLFSSKPSLLKKINQNLKDDFSSKINKSILVFLFDYERYSKILNNKLAKPLNLKVCPYCNRNYITYLPEKNDSNSTKKIIRPTYDHFFYKEKYFFLTLSFFNLIPSCYVCNSNLKLKIDFDSDFHINPLIEGFDDDSYFDFALEPDNQTGKINFTPILVEKIGIDSSRRDKIFGNGSKENSGNVKVFKLQEIYASHIDTVEDVYMNFDENNHYYAYSIKSELEKLETSESEFYRYHFKNYFDEIDFNKRPLAKLTKDIYTKMKEIDQLT